MIQYDSCGRMKYHPEYHENHGKPYTEEDLAYICATYRRGNRKEIALAVGRTDATISALVYQLKKAGRFEYYRKLGE